MLSVIIDKKIGVSSGGSTVDYYRAQVLSPQDYYPFGGQSRGEVLIYRIMCHGFNGKRIDNEIYGIGDFYDYGMRMFDPRGGRFGSMHPISSDYSTLSPFQYASNRPIDGLDINGQEC
jgi:RHS repeat-associated protein